MSTWSARRPLIKRVTIVSTNTPRRRAAFRQSDLQRALKVAKAEGFDVARVEIEPGGKVVLHFTSGAASDTVVASPLDAWLAENGSARPS
jgi:hypothetical protein